MLCPFVADLGVRVFWQCVGCNSGSSAQPYRGTSSKLERQPIESPRTNIRTWLWPSLPLRIPRYKVMQRMIGIQGWYPLYIPWNARVKSGIRISIPRYLLKTRKP